MNIKIISIITQKIGEKIYYWGKDTKNHIYVLNNYPHLDDILQSIPLFEQDHHNVFKTINFKNDQFFNIPRNKIVRITSTNYYLS